MVTIILDVAAIAILLGITIHSDVTDITDILTGMPLVADTMEDAIMV